jgi:regulator of RNase E activity RraA
VREDFVFADDDGVLFVDEGHLEQVLATAHIIWETERKQADAVRAGTTLREQFQFKEYLSKREHDPTYTFRKHLRKLGGAIEE